MTRMVWALVAVIVILAGYYLTLLDVVPLAGYLIVGVGVGIAAALLGSLVHDALSHRGERL